MNVTDKVRVFLALGSNIGDREANLGRAASILSAKAGLFVYRSSAIYESPAAGEIEQADYLNQVLEIEAWLLPTDILDICLAVEKEMGRVRKQPKGARNIDVDILLYSDLILRTDDLVIPHLELFVRPFFLVPLKELMGDVILPGENRRISEILAGLSPYEISIYNGKTF